MTQQSNSEETDTALEDLLAFIRDSRGFDFTGYKRSSLARRIRKRMHEAGSAGYLDFGLPTGEVRDIVNECLTTNRRTGPIQVAAINRIGRTITCIVTAPRLRATATERARSCSWKRSTRTDNGPGGAVGPRFGPAARLSRPGPHCRVTLTWEDHDPRERGGAMELLERTSFFSCADRVRRRSQAG